MDLWICLWRDCLNYINLYVNTHHNVEWDHFISWTLEKMGGGRWQTSVSMVHDCRCGAICCHHLPNMTVCSLNWELKYTISPFGCLCQSILSQRKEKKPENLKLWTISSPVKQKYCMIDFTGEKKYKNHTWLYFINKVISLVIHLVLITS